MDVFHLKFLTKCWYFFHPLNMFMPLWKGLEYTFLEPKKSFSLICQLFGIYDILLLLNKGQLHFFNNIPKIKTFCNAPQLCYKMLPNYNWREPKFLLSLFLLSMVAQKCLAPPHTAIARSFQTRGETFLCDHEERRYG